MNDGSDIRFQVIASRIINAMAVRGVGKQEFALCMGIQPSIITRWLSGTHNFTIDTLFKIEDTLGTQLIGVLEPPPSPFPIWKYKDNHYYVIRSKAVMKIGAIWVPCVVYDAVSTGASYVREREDFRAKFDTISDPPQP